MTQLRRFETKVGVAKESSWGSATAAVDVMPVTEIRENNVADVIRDQGLRGVSAREFTSQQGSLHGELTFGGLVYPEQMGHMLLNIFGSEAKTGAGPYAHNFKAVAAPVTHTIEVQGSEDTDDTLKYVGFRASKLDLTFEAATGAMAYSCEGSSIVGAVMTGTDPALPTFSNPFEGWRCAVTSGAGSLANRVISAEFHAMRELQVLHTLRDSQDPYYINLGPLAIEGACIMTVPDYTDFATWLAHTTTSLQFVFTYGTGVDTKTITILMTTANLANAPMEIDRSGVGITMKLNFLGLYNATDVGAAQVTLTNSRSTVY